MADLDKKVKQSIALLQQLKDSCDEVVELSYSGGKDSDIILELANYVGLNFRAIYKNTTIDPPGTIKHVKSKNVDIVFPHYYFFDLIKENGFPTRRARFCCKHLKEYKILNKAIQGIRASESRDRKKRYKEPVFCRVYDAKNKAEIFLPILNWEKSDVYDFIVANRIRVHPQYYDSRGYLDVNRRLGCMGCPLSIKSALDDFKKYPKFLQLYIKSGKAWMDTHPNAASHKKFGDVYNLFFHNYFCKNYDDYIYITTGFWRLDCKQWLCDFFKVSL